MLEKLKNIDKEMKIVNSLSQDDLVQVKIHFMNLLTKKENLTKATFDDVIKKTLKYLHVYFKKFINLDDFVKTISKQNTNVMSLFDCCREIKLKGKKEPTEEEKQKSEEKKRKKELEKKGIIDAEKVERKG